MPIDEVLDRNAFDLDRIIEIEPDFLEDGHHHHHDEDMQSSPSTSTARSIPEKFMPWISDLTQREGPNILRCKGIVAFPNEPKRFVFQGVHMILDGDLQRDWKPRREARSSRVVFIGRDLDETAIREGFLGLRGLTRAMTSTAAPSLAEQRRADRRRARMSSALALLGDTAAFALGDGARPARRRRRDAPVAAHPDGAILVAASDGERLVTGGDDGRVAVDRRRRLDARPSPRAKGAWIDALAAAPRARSPSRPGKTVTPRDDKGREKTLRRRPRPAASPSRRRAIGWRSPTTTASPSGSRTSRRSPRCSNGRARIST